MNFHLARIHSHRRGKSHSTRPASKRTPSWVTLQPEEIVSNVTKLSKEGLGPSHIGLALRDELAIPQVKTIVGKGIKEILAENKLRPALPEDLARLVERAAKLRNHLSAHHADRKNVRSLELLEAKIHRLSKYYKSTSELPTDWKYSAVVAQLA